jgi:hypothetical protein
MIGLQPALGGLAVPMTPEPATLAPLGGGLLTLGAAVRRRRAPNGLRLTGCA